MCQTKDPLNRQRLKDRAKKYKKNLFKLTRKTKANHCNNIFQENKLNLFRIWEGIQEIINITQKSNKEVDNRTINEPTEIVNEFNDHFAAIAQKIVQTLIKTKFNNSTYLRNLIQQSLVINPTNAKEVLFDTKNLIYSKATRPSSIPLKFIK